MNYLKLLLDMITAPFRRSVRHDKYIEVGADHPDSEMRDIIDALFEQYKDDPEVYTDLRK